MLRRAFLRPGDERLRATVLAIADELQENGFVLWLVSALSEIGETSRAAAMCERLLQHASPLGLYAEELDARTGRHLGNYPQAFTHLALINAVLHVISDEEAASE